MEYIIGSKLLGLKNTRDMDRLVFNSNVDYKRICKDGNDVVNVSEEYLKDTMRFINPVGKRARLMIYNYQLDQAIIGQNFPIKYNILDYKLELLELITRVILEKGMNFNKRITTNNGCCCKQVYHIAYNIFILYNNSPILTNEQKQIIQDIHDELVPIDYLDELVKILMEVLDNE